jgi:Fe-S-cluster-containing dehydrogenase component
MSKAFLYDSTVCIGCKQCEQACADQNKLPYNDSVASEDRQSDHKLTVVLTRGDKFMRRLCMNCQEPSCASVCPVGALKKIAIGPVTYDASKCMGCRYCMVACPFSLPKYEWGKLFPKVQKCTMCPDRVSAGKQTACAEICPTGATKLSSRHRQLQPPAGLWTKWSAPTSCVFSRSVATTRVAPPKCSASTVSHFITSSSVMAGAELTEKPDQPQLFESMLQALGGWHEPVTPSFGRKVGDFTPGRLVCHNSECSSCQM